MIRRLWNKYLEWKEERNLDRIIEEALQSGQVDIVRTEIKRQLHDSYKIGECTATEMKQHEITKRETEARLDWQRKEEERVARAEVVWMNVGGTDDPKKPRFNN
jgi:hypothetical protein